MKDLCISPGNSKLGKIFNFSLPPYLTCPGSTEWCKKNCYAIKYTKIYKSCPIAYQRNYEYSVKTDFTYLMINEIKKRNKNNLFRIHPSGDFYNEEYINKWIFICDNLPDIKFWCYTRSWFEDNLFEGLKKLNELKNIQVILSTDPTMNYPPENFRMAFVNGDERKSGIKCFHDEKLKKSCLECGYCYKDINKNVIFNKDKRRK